MIKSSSKKVTSFLFYNNYIDSNKYGYEVYLYGFEILIASILNILATLIIGLLFGKFIHTIVFLSCYCPLRQFSGGYHANNYRKCFITFICIFLITIFISNNLDYHNLKLIIILFSVLNWINIFVVAPIENINNPLTELEKIKYKRNVRVISSIVFLFIVINIKYLWRYDYFIYSFSALFWINTMINIEIIKNRRKIK